MSSTTTILSFDPAIKTTGYSYMKFTNDQYILDHYGLIDLTNDKKVKDCSFDDNITSLIYHLNELEKLNKKIDIVIIENIPSRLNPVVKSISVAIYMFYKIKNITVKFVNPNSKDKRIKECKTYAERKKKSVELCYELLNDDEKLKLSKVKKNLINNIADTILQSIFYFKNN